MSIYLVVATIITVDYEIDISPWTFSLDIFWAGSDLIKACDFVSGPLYF
jgi:hypothetical protein